MLRSLWAALGVVWVTGVLVGWVADRLVVCWPVSWDVVVAVDMWVPLGESGETASWRGTCWAVDARSQEGIESGRCSLGFSGVLAMRLWVVRFACVLVLGSSSTSFGQEPSGPRTLENLLKSDDAEQSAAAAGADVADAVPKRPSGTVIRAKDGVQHPDLDKAWADYDAAVAKASKGIQAAIAKQFDAAAAKGDLDAADKWQEIGEKFEKAGELPAEKETKTAVSDAIADFKKAHEKLTKAYEDAVKTLTMEKKIADAKAVRNESLLIAASPSGSETPQAATTRNRKQPEAKTTKVPSMKGAWLLSNGTTHVITQRDNNIGWAGQDNGFTYVVTCEWDGERFVGVCQRTNKRDGCVTRLRMVLTMLSATQYRQEQTALDESCDLPLAYKEIFEARKR